MFASLMFILTRLFELTTLIPPVGMLSYFVNGYVNANQLTPNYILVLFITTTLASVWALATLLRLNSSKRSGLFVAFIDVCFVGALIAGIYELRFIGSANCMVVTSGGFGFSISDGIYYTPFDTNANKTCSMLKASWAFAIMNCILFANSALMAMLMHKGEKEEKVVTRRRTSHESRRGHSSHRRSSRDSRRAYV